MGNGYAVVDVETTGLAPGLHHRVVEVAVVQLDHRGRTIAEWCTLVNPRRDLGPQHIHGIRAAEVRNAPTFADIAGDLAERLAGRVIVAHNLSFDARFLQAEFARAGLDVPLGEAPGLCTMRLADRFLRAAARSLAACCAAAGIQHAEAHSALHDARAAAALLALYLSRAGKPEPWGDVIEKADTWEWPAMSAASSRTLQRQQAYPQEEHFLARLVELLPRVVQPPQADDYLDVLDRALLDRHLSSTEQEELVDVARDLGLTLPDVISLHRSYLVTLARAAWSDGLVSGAESADLKLVAALLGLGGDDIGLALEEGKGAAGNLFRLERGDLVVFTGQMREPREVWEDRALSAGLAVNGAASARRRSCLWPRMWTRCPARRRRRGATEFPSWRSARSRGCSTRWHALADLLPARAVEALQLCRLVSWTIRRWPETTTALGHREFLRMEFGEPTALPPVRERVVSDAYTHRAGV